MADAQHLLQLFEGGVGVFFDVRLEFLGVELAPMSPALFRSQRTFFGGVQIPINGTPSYCKLPGGLGFGATVLNEFNHPFPQVQRIGFHARKSITLCPNVNMKCYMTPGMIQPLALWQDCRQPSGGCGGSDYGAGRLTDRHPSPEYGMFIFRASAIFKPQPASRIFNQQHAAMFSCLPPIKPRQ